MASMLGITYKGAWARYDKAKKALAVELGHSAPASPTVEKGMGKKKAGAKMQKDGNTGAPTTKGSSGTKRKAVEDDTGSGGKEGAVVAKKPTSVKTALADKADGNDETAVKEEQVEDSAI